MIIMDIRVDNLYAFKDFHMNMAYPKKVVNSPISGEFLQDRPNFRYRKVNVIMGSNATGKTTLGELLMGFANYLRDGNPFRFADYINNEKNYAKLRVDFIAMGNRLYRFTLKIKNNSVEDKIDFNCDNKLEFVPINKTDKYETCCDKLDNGKGEEIDYKEIAVPGWCFQYGNRIEDSIDSIDEKEYTKILSWVMKTLDPSVKSVRKVEDVENTYLIKLNNRTVIIQDGDVKGEKIFSSGTKMGFKIAYSIASMICKLHHFYYCDELFTYVNSDIEKACLSLMIDKLSSRGQLFFTTHNADILEMDLPKHSFCFLNKKVDSPNKIEYVNASDYLKKNTDLVRTALENDVFSTSPNVEKIYEIADIDK